MIHKEVSPFFSIWFMWGCYMNGSLALSCWTAITNFNLNSLHLRYSLTKYINIIEIHDDVHLPNFAFNFEYLLYFFSHNVHHSFRICNHSFGLSDIIYLVGTCDSPTWSCSKNNCYCWYLVIFILNQDFIVIFPYLDLIVSLPILCLITNFIA